jgi:hypothetical protein
MMPLVFHALNVCLLGRGLRQRADSFLRRADAIETCQADPRRIAPSPSRFRRTAPGRRPGDMGGNPLSPLTKRSTIRFGATPSSKIVDSDALPSVICSLRPQILTTAATLGFCG